MVTTIYDGKPGLSRRELLRRGGVGALLVISGSAVICPQYAWGVETAALKPETMKTLIQMARDIYPHDQLADRYYAIAVKSHDETAAKDPAHKDLIEQGVADLDTRAGPGGSRRSLNSASESVQTSFRYWLTASLDWRLWAGQTGPPRSRSAGRGSKGPWGRRATQPRFGKG